MCFVKRNDYNVGGNVCLLCRLMVLEWYGYKGRKKMWRFTFTAGPLYRESLAVLWPLMPLDSMRKVGKFRVSREQRHLYLPLPKRDDALMASVAKNNYIVAGTSQRQQRFCLASRSYYGHKPCTVRFKLSRGRNVGRRNLANDPFQEILKGQEAK